MTQSTRSRTTRLIVIVASSLLVLLVVVGGAVWSVTRDSRPDLTLHDVSTTASQNDGFANEALAGMTDETRALCAGVADCIEGYEAQKANLLRFASADAATAYAVEQADAYQSDWIVIVYKDASLSARGRSEVQTFIDTLWTSD